MRFIALLIVLAGLSKANECPKGFNDNGFNGSCISQRTGKLSRNDAYKACARDNSYLYEIQNAFTNNEIQSDAGSSLEIWLGLTCNSNKTTSCHWESGRALTPEGFSNFYGGAPNASVGACVLMKVSNGKWYSAPCTKTVANYGCQYSGGKKMPLCEGDAMYFRGNCYYVPPVSVANHLDGEVACWNSCGDYASIHSEGGNSVVRDLLSVNINASYSLLGLHNYGRNGRYYWDDSSSYNFNAFGYENYSMGYCVAMALVDGEGVENGKWINTQCNSSVPMNVVCMKDLDNSCYDEFPPSECVSPFFYSGCGYMYSPGFPAGSETSNCEYVITEDVGVASITFNELSLDKNGSISLYSNILDNIPFATFTNVNLTGQHLSSTTNTLRVVYNTSGGSLNLFKAFYGACDEPITQSPPVQTTGTYNKCGGNLLYNGTIQSPIGSNLSCGYGLYGDYDQTICIIFEILNLSPNSSLTLDDRFQDTQYIINEDVGKMFCGYNYFGLMNFNGSSTGDVPAFVARFSSSNWLNTTCNGGDFYGSGTISSVNYPLPYAPNMNCVYTLHSAKNKVTVVFTDIYAGPFEEYFDYIQVLDGSDDTELALINGWSSSYNVTSLSNVMRVVFVSDDDLQFRGFTAHFYSV